ncbi:hypothetical protein LQ50_16895 [Halalkalibacter okhensis]|uniref:Uncharacterized protein n=1 Tax=Halalkalibacter okhensis TaxID=333138 RepID=A0A0B0IHS5_9BACI|nr:hypothetical protein LQ50_16895 [Halalkalibacter okhensis]
MSTSKKQKGELPFWYRIGAMSGAAVEGLSLLSDLLKRRTARGAIAKGVSTSKEQKGELPFWYRIGAKSGAAVEGLKAEF